MGLAAAHVIEAVELRRRRALITELRGAEPGTHADLDVVVANGTRVDPATRAAAHQEMLDTGAQVVDLVPGDMAVDRALRLLRRVDPRRQATDPLYTPGGAHEAAVLEPSLVERMGQSGDQALDRYAMVRETVRVQRHAATKSVVRVAPELRSSPWAPEDRWRELESVYAWGMPYISLAPGAVTAETLHLLAMTAGLLVSPVAAAAALATWSAQPALVFGGSSPSGASGDTKLFTPVGAGQAGMMRLPRAIVDNFRTAVAGAKATREREAKRAETPVPAPPSPSELFEPRRDDCYWCGSTRIELLLDSPDLLQHKDGVFRLDECQDCGHIFQNPILTPAGLDWYYKDAYDGLGEESAEAGFAAVDATFYSRLDTIAKLTQPTSWLEVGTSRGAFCAVARTRFPEAEFHGLDMGDTVAEAQRRGRIDHGYQGFFQEIVDDIPRKYHVVSMDQYLEHTLDPRAEVGAAAKVVENGGYLMIEVPDPDSPWARRLGRYWWQWAQPQHVQFVTCQGMIDCMEQNGFEVVSVERGESTLGGEVFNAVLLKTVEMARSPHVPWLPKPSLAHRIKRLALFVASGPLLGAAKVIDEVNDYFIKKPGSTRPGNAYRIIGKKK